MKALKDYYKEFLEIRSKYFEDIKTAYFFAIDIAPKKENAHNVFEQEKMRPEEHRLHKELGQLSRILIDLRHEMELDSRIDEHKEFNLRFKKIEKAKQRTALNLIAESDGLNLMYSLWSGKAGTFQNGRSYFERYEERSQQILNRLTAELHSRVGKARNKKLAYDKFISEFMNPKREQLAPKLGVLGRFTNEVEDIYDLNNSKEREEIFNEKFDEIPFGKREESLELLAEFNANWLMLGVEREIYRKYVSHPSLKQIDEQDFSEFDESTETSETEGKNKISVNKSFTTARQVLAIHYLLKQLEVKDIDNTAKARFTQFLTGKEANNKNIKNTTIYKRICKPLRPNEASLLSDLQFVREYFEKLGLSEIVKQINKEINDR